RARYQNPNTGRFWTADPFEGNEFDPPTLHRYLYSNASPVTNVDSTGLFTLTDAIGGLSMLDFLAEPLVFPAQLTNTILNKLFNFAVNPVTNEPGIIDLPTGVPGQLRPGEVDGSGEFLAPRSG